MSNSRPKRGQSSPNLETGPVYPKPEDNKTVEDYITYMKQASARANPLERDLGWIRWCQGKALIACRKVCKKRGTWGEFLAAIDWSPSSAYLYRRLAETVTEEHARSKPYTELLALTFPSFKQVVNETDPANLTKSGARGEGKKGSGGKIEASSLTYLAFESSVDTILESATRIATKPLAFSTVRPSVANEAYLTLTGEIDLAIGHLRIARQRIEEKIARNDAPIPTANRGGSEKAVNATQATVKPTVRKKAA